MASFGNYGQHKQNIQRDLYRHAKKVLGRVLEPYWIKIRGYTDDQTEVQVDWPVLLPHEWFAALHGAGDKQWKLSMLGPDGEESLARFWSTVRGAPWLADHPVYGLDSARQAKMVPFFMFGDDAAVFEHEKMCVMFAGSVMSDADSWDSRFLYSIMPYNWMIPGKTLEDMHQPLAWSFDCGFDGLYPHLDHLGSPLGPQHGVRCKLQGRRAAAASAGRGTRPGA